MSHSKIFTMYKQLRCVKGPVLLIQSSRISNTQGNNRITKRRPSEDLILMVSKKPEPDHGKTKASSTSIAGLIGYLLVEDWK